MSVALFVPTTSLGAEPSEQPTARAPPETPFDILDPQHDYWSKKLAVFAGRIDRFFGDDQEFQETNDSVMQLDLDEVVKEGGNLSTTLGVRANLALPLAEKRWHLLLETDPEKVTAGETTPDRAVLPNESAAPKSYAAALRYQKVGENIWHFSVDGGIALRSTPTPYTRARGSVSIPVGTWRMRLTETLFWFTNIGAGESSQLDLEHAFSDPVLFRATSNATWLDDKQRFDLRQDLSIYHTLDDSNGFVYQVSAVGVSQPQAQVTEYVALVRYRYRLHRDWLFLELSPQLHYPKEQDYHVDPQFIVRFEMLIGGAK